MGGESKSGTGTTKTCNLYGRQEAQGFESHGSPQALFETSIKNDTEYYLIIDDYTKIEPGGVMISDCKSLSITKVENIVKKSFTKLN